jgi:hypothetical protein
VDIGLVDIDRAGFVLVDSGIDLLQEKQGYTGLKEGIVARQVDIDSHNRHIPHTRSSC